MKLEHMGLALAGMAKALGEGKEEGQLEALSQLKALGPIAQGGYIAALAMQKSSEGAPLGEDSLRHLAGLSKAALRGSESSLDAQAKLFSWVRGALASVSASQGLAPSELPKRFAGIYSSEGFGAMVDIMMSQPFFSTEICPNAIDMAPIMDDLISKARSGEVLPMECVEEDEPAMEFGLPAASLQVSHESAPVKRPRGRPRKNPV